MKTKAAQFILLAASALFVSAIDPLSVFAQTSCSSLASLSITSPKTTYQVGESVTGEVVFTNNASPAQVDFSARATKDGQTIINNSYAAETRYGQNRWTTKDAFGTDVLPSAGTYVLSVAASYAPLGCTWNASLTLTAPAPPTPPRIDSLNTPSAPFGSTVTINGSGFGLIPFGNNIESGSVVISRNIFSPDGKTLVFTVPDVYPGSYPISVSNVNGTSNEVMFTVTPAKPWIESIDPSSAQPGTQVTIKGGNFATALGNDIKSGATVIVANVFSPDGKILVFTVPEVTPGTYPVSVFSSWFLRGTSNEVSFTVLAPPPQNLLASLTISPQEYLLGETVTGSVSVDNPSSRPIIASFRIELYKGPPTGPGVLVWSRDIDQVSVAPGTHQFSLDDVFGFKPTIPEDPFFVGDWQVVIRNKGLPADIVSQTFTIKAPVVPPLTLAFNFDPKEYVLGDTLQGTGAVTNPGSSPVKTSFKIELFQGLALKWQREIKDISVPPGASPFTVDDLFGLRVVIPNEPSLIGDWKLKITQVGATPPVSAEADFKIQSITAACKPTTGTPESGIFGIVKGWFIWTTEQRDLDSMKEAGLKWTRLELRWDQIEKEKGKFDWSFYDQVVKNLDDNNIRILAQLQSAPSWANGQIGKKFNEWYPPNDLNDWANFVKRAVNRYKPGGEIALKNPVIYWEIWNEPNTLPFWQPAPDVAKYIQMLAVSNKAIREIDPKAIIVGISEAGIDPIFTPAIYEAGAKNCFDVISFHPYGSVQDLKPKTEAIKKFLVDHDDANKPIWYTEYGFETGVGKGTTEAQQAEYLKQTYYLYSQGLVPAFFWIALRDEAPPTDFTFGILHSDFTKKPAFDVLKNLLNPQPAGPIYFQFDDGSSRPETFIFKLTDAAKIAEARRILAGQNGRKVHTMGTIVKSPEPYNPPWSYHLNSDTVTFFENAIEVCDASIRYVEEHLNEWPVLPNNLWCPWSSRLLREVAPPSPGISINVDAAKIIKNIQGLKPSINIFQQWDGYMYTANKLKSLLNKYNEDIGIKDRFVRVQEDWPDLLVQDITVFSEIIKLGGKPIILFNDMPISLARDPTNPKFYSLPPRSYEEWQNYVYEVVKKYKALGVRTYEIWNEAEIDESWSGTQDEFFKLYESTVNGIITADPGALIFGPAALSISGEINPGDGPFLPNLIDYAKSKNLPLHVMSWHDYDDYLGLSPKEEKERIELLRKKLNDNGYTATLLAIDEWSPIGGNARSDVRLDSEYSSAFVVSKIAGYIYNGIDYQSLYDFIEGNDDQTFYGLFGIFTPEGVIKAKYNSLKILAKMDDNLIYTTLNGNPSNFAFSTKSDNKVSLVLSNPSNARIPNVKIDLKNIPQQFTRYTKYIIDATHSNAYSVKDKIIARINEAKTQAVPQAKETFKSVLRQRGYSEPVIAIALSYFEKYLADNSDPEVIAWLNSLTPQQKQDVLNAFSQAMNKYGEIISTVADEINNWPEVKLYSETKTVTVPDGTYSENLSLEPYAVQFIILSK